MLNDRNVKGIGFVFNDDRSILLNKRSQRLNAENNLFRAKQVSCNPNPSLFYFVLFAPQIHPEIKRTLFALRCWQSLTLATQVVNFEQKETFLPFSSLVKFSQVLLHCINCVKLHGVVSVAKLIFKKSICWPFVSPFKGFSKLCTICDNLTPLPGKLELFTFFSSFSSVSQ